MDGAPVSAEARPPTPEAVVVWGLVVGWTITGARECLGGPQALGTALVRRWPLAVGVILVLVNSVGPVLVMQATRVP